MLRILKDEVNTMWERESIKDGATSLATNFEREQGMIESNEWWKFAAAGGQEEVRRQVCKSSSVAVPMFRRCPCVTPV